MRPLAWWRHGTAYTVARTPSSSSGERSIASHCETQPWLLGLCAVADARGHRTEMSVDVRNCVGRTVDTEDEGMRDLRVE